MDVDAIEASSEAARVSLAAMLVASVRVDAERSGCSERSGDDGWVEMDEGAGVLSDVLDARV